MTLLTDDVAMNELAPSAAAPQRLLKFDDGCRSGETLVRQWLLSESPSVWLFRFPARRIANLSSARCLFHSVLLGTVINLSRSRQPAIMQRIGVPQVHNFALFRRQIMPQIIFFGAHKYAINLNIAFHRHFVRIGRQLPKIFYRAGDVRLTS